MANRIGNLTARNPTAEGSGRARSAWIASIQQSIAEGDGFFSPFTSGGWTVEAEDRKRIATGMREYSEMVGFWIAWHSTGGFDRLEDHGWNRATIYRKIKRFKEHFGQHPDDYEFEWRSIDHDRAWDAAATHVYDDDDDDGVEA